MKQHDFWKRTAAGILAVLLVCGSVPLAGVSDVFEQVSIVASAETNYVVGNGTTEFAVPTATGDTVTISNTKYYKTTASTTPKTAAADLKGTLSLYNNNSIRFTYKEGESTNDKTETLAAISAPNSNMTFAGSVTVNGTGADAKNAFTFTPNYAYKSSTGGVLLSTGDLIAKNSYVGVNQLAKSEAVTFAENNVNEPLSNPKQKAEPNSMIIAMCSIIIAHRYFSLIGISYLKSPPINAIMVKKP